MDDPSQHAIQMLDAISRAVDRLEMLSYNTYLKFKCVTRGPGRSITVGGSSHHKGAIFFLGSSISPRKDEWLGFYLTFDWPGGEWAFHAWIDQEFYNIPDEFTPSTTLWERRYTAQNLQDGVQILNQALNDRR